MSNTSFGNRPSKNPRYDDDAPDDLAPGSSSSGGGSSSSSSSSDLVVSIGPLLPLADSPAPPTSVGDVPLDDFIPVDQLPYAWKARNGTFFLFVADLTYIPIIAQTSGSTATFAWNGVTDVYLNGDGFSFAILNLNPEDEFVQVSTSEGVKNLHIFPVIATPPLIVPGQSNLTVTIHAEGFNFETDDSFEFETGSGLSVSNVKIVNGDLSGSVSATASATPGAVKVILHIDKGKNTVTCPDAFNVYQGVVWSLIQMLNRPDSTHGPQAQPGVPGTGPRTPAQDARITAILNTTAATVGTPWEAWVSADASLTAGRPATPITHSQISVLIDAASQIEANTNAPAAPTPPVPVSMWNGFLTFLAGIEGIWNVLAIAQVTAEDSYGLLQFKDDRAHGINFHGGNFPNSPSVPIYDNGIQYMWKSMILSGQTSVANLITRVTMLNSDWRADPFASLINGIRNAQSFYGELMIAPRGTLTYDPLFSYRVDLTPTTPTPRPDGDGNQRDTFQLLSVAHNAQGNVFGHGVFSGGLTTNPGPPRGVETWTPTNTTPPPPSHMNDEGVQRATAAANYWDTNSGGRYT